MSARPLDERQSPITPAPAPATRTSDLWWKKRRHLLPRRGEVRRRNGDGVGDFVGLTQKVDYLAGLGVTCLWLMPFYATPNQDDGYDVSDYYALDPRLGSFGDFVAFMRTARDRGLRVITELIVNHTSDEHPWFLAARDRDSPLHGFYVWQDERPEEEPADIVFPDEESSVWAWDEDARRWYLHRFYSFQPDLNVGNPLVRDEIRKIAGFWLQLGVDGFRVDAAPYLVDTTGLEGDAHADALDWLRELCSYVQRRDGGSMMIGEVNLPPRELRPYFGDDDGDGLHMLFNFNLNQALFLSLARGECDPLDRALDALPEIPERSQWVNFVRNHDELTLDKLDDHAREDVYRAFAPEERMRLYGRGIRRRLPTMLGDRARIELAYSLLFTLPGTQALLWGEEIGLAEDLELEDRLAVRVPMQWTEGPNGGFSAAPAEQLVAPVRQDGPYGFERVNVASQRHDPDSLLNWMERMIRQRRECHEIGWGVPKRLSTGRAASSRTGSTGRGGRCCSRTTSRSSRSPSSWRRASRTSRGSTICSRASAWSRTTEHFASSSSLRATAGSASCGTEALAAARPHRLKCSIEDLKNASAARASSDPVVPDELIERAAARFALLSDPTRLRLVSALHLHGEGSVGALAEAAGISVANASQHLNRLAAGGVVGRRREGTSVRYRIVDDSIEQLCHLVCDALGEDPR